MRRLLVYAMILLLVWVVPTERADVAKLRPIEVIAIYKNGNTVVLFTDTEDMGMGINAVEALKNMRSTSPAIIYLDTAEYLLVEDAAADEVELLRTELKESIRLCYVSGKADLKSVAKYLPVHDKLPALRNWKAGDVLPVLRIDNERLKISENSENSA